MNFGQPGRVQFHTMSDRTPFYRSRSHNNLSYGSRCYQSPLQLEQDDSVESRPLPCAQNVSYRGRLFRFMLVVRCAGQGASPHIQPAQEVDLLVAHTLKPCGHRRGVGTWCQCYPELLSPSCPFRSKRLGPIVSAGRCFGLPSLAFCLSRRTHLDASDLLRKQPCRR